MVYDEPVVLGVKVSWHGWYYNIQEFKECRIRITTKEKANMKKSVFSADGRKARQGK